MRGTIAQKQIDAYLRKSGFNKIEIDSQMVDEIKKSVISAFSKYIQSAYYKRHHKQTTEGIEKGTPVRSGRLLDAIKDTLKVKWSPGKATPGTKLFSNFRFFTQGRKKRVVVYKQSQPTIKEVGGYKIRVDFSTINMITKADRPLLISNCKHSGVRGVGEDYLPLHNIPNRYPLRPLATGEMEYMLEDPLSEPDYIAEIYRVLKQNFLKSFFALDHVKIDINYSERLPEP